MMCCTIFDISGVLIFLQLSQNEGPRYNVRAPPDGVETAVTVLSVSNDLVFNCLVDSAKIDTIALLDSLQESEEKLHVSANNRSSIRGGVIREVHFLPNGDSWRVYNGSKSMMSNTRAMRQVIGVDRTTSIRETESEKQQLEIELKDLASKQQNLSRERHEYKVQWNNLNKEDKNMRVEMQDLEETISRIQLEAAAAENVTFDTKDYEDDVQHAAEVVDDLKSKEEETKKEIEELMKPIGDLEAKVEETQSRSAKVSNDLQEATNRFGQYMRTKQNRETILDKKRTKVAQLEDHREKFMERIEESAEKRADTKFKAQRATYQYQQDQKSSDEEGDQEDQEDNDVDLSEDEIKAKIEAIEPIETNKTPDFYKNKIERGEKEIEKERKRRQISEVDPEVALMKYQRAQKDLDDKIQQLHSIEANEVSLVDDLKARRKMWKAFRGKY